MSQNSEKSDDQGQRINNVIDDGGGCTEAWEATSEMRESSRRSFVVRLGVTLGAIPVGAGALSSSSSAAEERSEQETEEINGEEKQELIDEARSSSDVQFIFDNLEVNDEVISAFEYTLQDGDSGRGVVFGTEQDSGGGSIQYYESETFAGDTRVVGSQPSGEGAISVDADQQTIIHVGETPQQKEAVEDLKSTEQYAEFERRVDEGSPEEEEAIVVFESTTSEEPQEIIVPVVKNEEVIDKETFTQGPTTQQSFDACTALCTAISGLAGSACMAKCAGTIAGLPISPGCAAVCAGAAAGTCVPTCQSAV